MLTSDDDIDKLLMTDYSASAEILNYLLQPKTERDELFMYVRYGTMKCVVQANIQNVK